MQLKEYTKPEIKTLSTASTFAGKAEKGQEKGNDKNNGPS